ncbi:TrpB-like pyridoxal phosphate-dependent enzyme [Yimella sp. cx-51]|uniref:TrpB-like pyridoxal phosphate-dependent enzyme n=1 Tax=Yimella sp. cx-51 TaxID=2770551 RepID=UPI00165DA6CB|nr:TrpB-like pyridoxal phosphate-dependent enzyme [Yimella sp. cx-51]MBC9957766.1 TrpB-like pyridoxal phosphate-dependent enzyme [Yimella sp. cx-51]QTH36890.1 TrpB-like pyridoxal phosphate-dependent enzyme [Yimella sp. cx-51]
MPEELTRVVLDESQIPTHWYNLLVDFPEPLPPHLHPGTKEPVGPDDLAPLFPVGLIAQEVSDERFIEIPERVREIYKTWRPSPLVRARNLEKVLGTPARIYYKYEGSSPVGSHKPNTAVAQAYYNHLDGVKKVTTETGAGQWGSSLAMACAMFDMTCEVWQVAASYESKPYRRMMIETYGSTIHSSPSELTESGRQMREQFPGTTGSLGMAVSEAVEAAATDPEARYALGSVLNHVMLHQTVIGEEVLKQLAIFGETQADVVFGCAGGGSNLAGLTFPLLRENLDGNTTSRLVAVEPEACPSLTKGTYEYDHGDVAGLTPLMKMYTLGRDFVPDPIHAGGLRYHAMSPMVSHAVHLGLMEALAIGQDEAFEAGVIFARAEGLIPAPESTHAIAGAVREAKRLAETGEEKSILIGLSGNGVLDLPAYADHLAGQGN